MALRLTTLKHAAVESQRMLESPKLQLHFCDFSSLRQCHRSPYRLAAACLPEFYQDQSDSFIDNKIFRFSFPSFSFGGSMELMAVPKKKISKHKRGIRNGPKALKPTPVIICCRSCGRVKLPHFHCSSVQRSIPDEHSNSNN